MGTAEVLASSATGVGEELGLEGETYYKMVSSKMNDNCINYKKFNLPIIIQSLRQYLQCRQLRKWNLRRKIASQVTEDTDPFPPSNNPHTQQPPSQCNKQGGYRMVSSLSNYHFAICNMFSSPSICKMLCYILYTGIRVRGSFASLQ